MMKEVLTLKKLSHPNTLRLYECFEYGSSFSIVVDLCAGGELFDCLHADGALVEKDAASVVK